MNKHVYVACVGIAAGLCFAAQGARASDGYDPRPVSDLSQANLPSRLDPAQRLPSGPALGEAKRDVEGGGPTALLATEGCFREETTIDGKPEAFLSRRSALRVFRHVRVVHTPVRESPVIKHSLIVTDGWLEDGPRAISHVVSERSVSLDPLALGPDGVVAYGYKQDRFVHVITEKGQRFTGSSDQCAMLEIVLDTQPKDAAVKRVMFTSDDGRRTWLSASVSKVALDWEPVVSVSFSR